MPKILSELDQLVDLPFDVVTVPEVQTDGTIVYIASHPELPGCMSHGGTPEEARESLDEARRVYLASLLQRGLDIPRPDSPSASLEIAMVQESVTLSDVRGGGSVVDFAGARADLTLTPIG